MLRYVPITIRLLLLIVLLALGATALPIAAQETADQDESAEPQWKLKEYFVVFLDHGPNRDQPDSVAQELQKQHLANIDRLWKMGKAIISGPFGDGRGGLIIMTNTTREEAEKLVAEDPMIKVGRLTAEVRSWWAAEGILPEPETDSLPQGVE